MKQLITAIVCLSAIGFINASMNEPFGCNLSKTKTRKVFSGWPTKFSCRDLMWNPKHKQAFGTAIENATCTVIDPAFNTTLWEVNMLHRSHGKVKTFYTDDITDNSTKVYHVIYQRFNSTCFYEEIILNITDLMKPICRQDRPSDEIIDLHGRKSSLKQMTCSVAHSQEPTIDLDDGLHSYIVTWYRNCTELDTSDKVFRVKGRELLIKSLDFNLAGEYSCSITYKNQTMFPIQFNLCVQPRTTYQENGIIYCPETVKTTVGNTVKLACDVHFGYKTISYFGVYGSWQQVGRNSSFHCIHYGDSPSKHGWNDRAECFSNYSQEHNNKCYLYEPSEEEQTPIQTILKMNLLIKNIQESDFGMYVATMNDFGKSSNKTIILLADNSNNIEDFYIYIIIGLSVAVGLLFLSLLIVFVIRPYLRNSKFM